MKKQILFIEPFPTVMIYKLAKIFRQKGYETILIILLESESSKDFHLEAFDKVIYFNLKFHKLTLKNSPLIAGSMLKKLKDLTTASFLTLKIKPYVVFARAAPSWPCALARKFFKNYPVIYFPYDIRTEYYKTKEQAKKYGGLPNFEIKAERYCFENADGVMHKGYSRELEYLDHRMLGENLKIAEPQLSFFPYCTKEFSIPLNKNKLSRQDNEIHIVHIDSMGSVGPIGASYVYDDIRELVKQGIHVHVYSRPNSITIEELKNFFVEDSEFTRKYKDILDSRFFHFHLPLEPEEIVYEISKYDYGLYPSGPETGISNTDLELKFSTGNKISSYLEAGIPFLVEGKAVFTGQLIKRYGVGFVYTQESIKKLKFLLDKVDYRKIEENIEKARQDFDMDKNFPRLEKFMGEVVVKKRAMA